MLFLLTGHIQLGKTRWLEARLDELRAAGVEPWGVLTPGVWRTCETDAEHPYGLEKVGIRMRFLPAGEERPYAVRSDLSEDAGVPGAEATGTRLPGWRFFDERFAEANALFAQMGAMDGADGVRRVAVIDELGRLELERKEPAGLTEALAFVKNGPTSAFPHTVAVVRDFLLDAAMAKLSAVRPDGVTVISPDEAGSEALLATVLRQGAEDLTPEGRRNPGSGLFAVS